MFKTWRILRGCRDLTAQAGQAFLINFILQIKDAKIQYSYMQSFEKCLKYFRHIVRKYVKEMVKMATGIKLTIQIHFYFFNICCKYFILKFSFHSFIFCAFCDRCADLGCLSGFIVKIVEKSLIWPFKDSFFNLKCAYIY